MEPKVSPFSTGCNVSGQLLVVSTLAELEAAQFGGKLLLMRGEVAKEQFMPKHFPFYNPEEHQKIVAMLEGNPPRAIIAATSENPEMAGALYPFPLFEDGDFEVPSVFMTAIDGDQLASYAGCETKLEIRAERNAARGVNVVAARGNPQRRVVLFAHIDTKEGTPGAIDNASGVVVLLLLGERLSAYSGELGVEIVAMNGEDYYSVPGEQLYLRMNDGRFDEIVLGINLDGLGYIHGRTGYSLYNCPADLDRIIRESIAPFSGLVEGEPWFQGDHGLFLFHQRPALAITSEHAAYLMQNFIHTARDTPDIVDPVKLAEVASALYELIVKLERS